MWPSGETAPLVAKGTSSLQRTLWVVLAAGGGLIADGYDLFVVDVVVALMASIYPGTMEPHGKSFAVSMTYVGIILGQLVFGALADHMGPRVVSIATASLMTLSCLLSACCMDADGFGIAYQLGWCRFLLGCGVGGEYPIAAALSMDGQSRWAGAGALCLSKSQCIVMNGVFFCVGALVAPLAFLCLLATTLPLDVVWRVALVTGAVPSLVTAVLRIQTFEDASLGAGLCGTRAREGTTLAERLRAMKPHFALLVGCSAAWAVQNFVSYGLGSFKSLLNEQVFGVDRAGTDVQIRNDAVFAFFCSLFSLLGSIGMMFLVESGLSHVQLQLIGFVGMAVALLFLSTLLGALPSQNWQLLATFFFYSVISSTVGNTIFMIPAENFPRLALAGSFGIAAASGKVGAMVGTAVFPLADQRIGLAWVLFGNGLVCLLGGTITILLPLDRGRDRG